MQAHAGIGDKFPVQGEAGVTLFEVLLAKGDDDHVVLEVTSKQRPQKIDLARDKTGEVEVAGIKYGLEYPSVFVNAIGNTKPATPKAMIIVTCRH